MALDCTTGEPVWQTSRSHISWSSPALIETKTGLQLILLNDEKYVTAYNPASGKQVLLYLLEATPKRFTVLSKAQMLDRSRCWTPLALSRGKLIIRDQKQMKCLIVTWNAICIWPPPVSSFQFCKIKFCMQMIMNLWQQIQNRDGATLQPLVSLMGSHKKYCIFFIFTTLKMNTCKSLHWIFTSRCKNQWVL